MTHDQREIHRLHDLQNAAEIVSAWRGIYDPFGDGGHFVTTIADPGFEPGLALQWIQSLTHRVAIGPPAQ